MLLVLNTVPDSEFNIDKRLSQAGLNYQKKLKDCIPFSKAFCLVPLFLNCKFNDELNCEYISCPIEFPKFRAFINAIKCVYTSFVLFKKIIKESDCEVLYYNVDNHNLISILLLMLFGKKKLYLIAADYFLPSSLFLKHVYEYVYSNFDGVLSLSPNIKCNDNTMVMLGLISSEELFDIKKNYISNNFLFSGSLGKTTGFELIVDVFKNTPQYSLNITGMPFRYSTLEFNKIINDISFYDNISYMGMVDFSEYNEILLQTDIAFSLRDPFELEHDFNFPSKILEYFSRGIFVISSKKYSLIPDDIIFYCDFNSSSVQEQVYKVINLSLSDKLHLKQKMYEFVKSNFSKSQLINNFKLLGANFD